MERHKWHCLHRILKCSGQGIGLYLDSVKKVEWSACACNEGRISVNPDKFMEMMVLDSCFVIEMFQGLDEGFENLGYFPNDPVFSMRGSIPQIQWDVIMLKNQILLFILDQPLILQLSDPNQKECVAETHIPGLEFDQLYDHGKVHCLEGFRRSLMHLCPKRPRSKRLLQCWPQFTYCLTKLHEARLKMRLDLESFLGDIKFEDEILRIPHLGRGRSSST
ncbi:uncharacterized protein LOC120288447 [Eucalyptus grandis]|uniref:uncharacterized protein LOC120288447 n=1 Tax=Eucalyptus grandis TaxID=71139 RepID=UPI00192EE423|nr:uncharacterized protein LOC120288447 [Eucalyptus grandis]